MSQPKPEWVHCNRCQAYVMLPHACGRAEPKIPAFTPAPPGTETPEIEHARCAACDRERDCIICGSCRKPVCLPECWSRHVSARLSSGSCSPEAAKKRATRKGSKRRARPD